MRVTRKQDGEDGEDGGGGLLTIVHPRGRGRAHGLLTACSLPVALPDSSLSLPSLLNQQTSPPVWEDIIVRPPNVIRWRCSHHSVMAWSATG